MNVIYTIKNENIKKNKLHTTNLVDKRSASH